MYLTEKYAYLSGCGLLHALDEMVESADFSNYHLLRMYLERKLNRLDHNNPFGAGRRPTYDSDDEKSVVHMKLQENKTNREIAQIMKCSTSTVSRLYGHGLKRMQQNS